MPKPSGKLPSWVRLSSIGTEFAGAVAGFALLGYLIDRSYESSPWGVLIGTILGIVGGLYNLIKASLREIRKRKREKAASHAGTGDQAGDVRAESSTRGGGDDVPTAGFDDDRSLP
ncbi:MAG: AtpZ/AtpI family protein [Phycisphaerae bacterium]